MANPQDCMRHQCPAPPHMAGSAKARLQLPDRQRESAKTCRWLHLERSRTQAQQLLDCCPLAAAEWSSIGHQTRGLGARKEIVAVGCLLCVLQGRPVSPDQAHGCCSLGFVTPFKGKVQSSILVCWQTGGGKVSVLLLEQVHSRLLHFGGAWGRQQCHQSRGTHPFLPGKCNALGTGTMGRHSQDCPFASHPSGLWDGANILGMDWRRRGHYKNPSQTPAISVP